MKTIPLLAILTLALFGCDRAPEPPTEAQVAWELETLEMKVAIIAGGHGAAIGGHEAAARNLDLASTPSRRLEAEERFKESRARRAERGRELAEAQRELEEFRRRHGLGGG